MFFPIVSPSLATSLMKVPFEEVPELVAGRKVFIHKGHAYVASTQVEVDTFYKLLHQDNIDLIYVAPFPCRLFPLLPHNFVVIYPRHSF